MPPGNSRRPVSRSHPRHPVTYTRTSLYRARSDDVDDQLGRRISRLACARDEAPGRRVHDQDHPCLPGASCACLPVCPRLSTRHLQFLTDRLAAHRVACGTRWRRLSAGRQALLVLAHLRLGHTYAQLAAGFKVGVSTVYRYIAEAVGLFAARAPDLATAVTAASAKAFVILDGTLLPIDRIAADRPFYSRKHKKHGMSVQVIADPHGKLLWASPALPGAVHDIKAARTHGIIDALSKEGLACWADKGYQGAGGTVRTQIPRPGTVPFIPRPSPRAGWRWRPRGPGAVRLRQGRRRTALAVEAACWMGVVVSVFSASYWRPYVISELQAPLTSCRISPAGGPTAFRSGT